jgi:NAD(P)-dependent dehydrogenase (short-subunit alcohol dehydrogenase family)
VGLRLEGKTAVVVGAGQTPGASIGNGRATAVVFAREGARVLLADRDLAAAEETAATIAAEVGVEPPVCRADVLEEEDCARLARTAEAVLGHVDVLHNNVGIAGDAATPVELTQDAWDHVMSTNLKGTWLTCKYVLPLMQARNSGSIVNVSSIASLMNGSPSLPYALSKAAVNTLTTSLAVDNARYGIRVNAVLPGLISTPMAVDASARMLGIPRETVDERRDAMVPMGKQGTGWDIANAALFLASDDAAFITGVLLPVDGGQTLRRW